MKKDTKISHSRIESAKLEAFSVVHSSDVMSDNADMSINIDNPSLPYSNHEITGYGIRPFMIILLAVWPITYGAIFGLLTILAITAKNNHDDKSFLIVLCCLNLLFLQIGVYVSINECQESVRANNTTELNENNVSRKDIEMMSDLGSKGSKNAKEISKSPENNSESRKSSKQTSAKQKINMHAYPVYDQKDIGNPGYIENITSKNTQYQVANEYGTINVAMAWATICMSIAFVGLFCFGFMLGGSNSKLDYGIIRNASSFLLKGTSCVLIFASISCLW